MVDDHAQLRELFAKSLNRQQGIRCTRSFASGAEILAVLDEERPPDVLLLDINLGSESGLDLIRPIKKLAPKLKVVMFTMFRNVHSASEAFKAGASGFVLKTYEIEAIVRMIRQAHDQPEIHGLLQRHLGGTLPEMTEGSSTDGSMPRRFSLADGAHRLLRSLWKRIPHRTTAALKVSG